MKKFVLCVVVFMFAFVSIANAAYYDEGNDGDSWETAYIKLFRNHVCVRELIIFKTQENIINCLLTLI